MVPFIKPVKPGVRRTLLKKIAKELQMGIFKDIFGETFKEIGSVFKEVGDDYKKILGVQSVASAKPKRNKPPKDNFISGGKVNPASDFEYDLNNAGDGVIIKGIKRKLKTVIIPDTIEGFPVTEIRSLWLHYSSAGQWEEEECKRIDYVLGDPRGEFIHVHPPYSISIPKTVVTFGCSGCAIKEIDLPEGITCIYFAGCGFLKSIRIPPNVTSITKHAFAECVNLTEIHLPEGLKEIGEKAFECCIKLKEITFPESLERIGHMAFSNCESLEKIKFPSHPIDYCKGIHTGSVTKRSEITGIKWEETESCAINNAAFSGCVKLFATLAGKKALRDTGYPDV